MTAVALSLPLRWLRLSDRTAEIFEAADVIYVGDLVELSPEAVMALPNGSRKSLVEVERALARLDLTLERPVGDWDRELARAQMEQDGQRLLALAAAVTGDAASAGGGLTDALRGALTAVGESPRNVDLIMAHLGWSGLAPRTQLSVSRDAGLSPARFQQIVGRARGRLRRGPPPAAVQRLMDYLERSSPLNTASLADRLLAEGLSDVPLCEAALGNLTLVFGLESKFEILSGRSP